VPPIASVAACLGIEAEAGTDTEMDVEPTGNPVVVQMSLSGPIPTSPIQGATRQECQESQKQKMQKKKEESHSM
jgi:hypothetical protein